MLAPHFEYVTSFTRFIFLIYAGHLREFEKTESEFCEPLIDKKVLASALQVGNLDSRLVEALPWVLLSFQTWIGSGRDRRPDGAKHWGLLTDLSPDNLSYGD